MPTQYQVGITLSGATVAALQENNFALYGFQAVKASAHGAPVVWFQTQDFALSTGVTWQDGWQVYTSRSQTLPNGRITAEASYPIEPGQVFTISNAMGMGEVSPGGPGQAWPSGMSIVNLTPTPFTCGLEVQRPDGSFGPICALPLFGENLDVIVPTGKVYLMFSSLPIDAGAVMEQAYGPGILIDFTEAQTRSVAYDINGGWSWPEGAAWAQSYPPNQGLVPLLFQPLALADPQ